MSAPTWRWTAWRVIVRSAPAPARARLGAAQAVHELELVDEVRGHGDGSPVLSPALERGDPDLGGLEVEVAGPDGQRLAHAAAGERERAGERLHRGLAVGAHRGEEAVSLLGRQVLSPAGVDQREVAFGHRFRGARRPGR